MPETNGSSVSPLGLRFFPCTLMPCSSVESVDIPVGGTCEGEGQENGTDERMVLCELHEDGRYPEQARALSLL